MIGEITDEQMAAVVKSIRREGDGGAHQNMMEEVSVSIMQYINETELEEVGEEEAEEILSDIVVKGRI